MKLSFLIYNVGLDKMPQNLFGLTDANFNDRTSTLMGKDGPAIKGLDICGKKNKSAATNEFINDYNKIIQNRILSLIKTNGIDVCVFQEFCPDSLPSYRFPSYYAGCYLFDSAVNNCSKLLVTGSTNNSTSLSIPSYETFEPMTTVSKTQLTGIFPNNNYQIIDVTATKNKMQENVTVINLHDRVFDRDNTHRLRKWYYLIGSILSVVEKDMKTNLIICGDAQKSELVNESYETLLRNYYGAEFKNDYEKKNGVITKFNRDFEEKRVAYIKSKLTAIPSRPTSMTDAEYANLVSDQQRKLDEANNKLLASIYQGELETFVATVNRLKSSRGTNPLSVRDNSLITNNDITNAQQVLAILLKTLRIQRYDLASHYNATLEKCSRRPYNINDVVYLRFNSEVKANIGFIDCKLTPNTSSHLPSVLEITFPTNPITEYNDEDAFKMFRDTGVADLASTIMRFGNDRQETQDNRQYNRQESQSYNSTYRATGSVRPNVDNSDTWRTTSTGTGNVPYRPPSQYNPRPIAKSTDGTPKFPSTRPWDQKVQQRGGDDETDYYALYRKYRNKLGKK